MKVCMYPETSVNTDTLGKKEKSMRIIPSSPPANKKQETTKSS